MSALIMGGISKRVGQIQISEDDFLIWCCFPCGFMPFTCLTGLDRESKPKARIKTQTILTFKVLKE